MYRDKKAVAIVSDNFFKDILYSRIIEEGIFDDAIPVKRHGARALLLQEPDLDLLSLEEKTIHYYDDVFLQNHYDISSFDAVIYMCDYDDIDFALYLVLKKIQYIQIEIHSTNFINAKLFLQKKVMLDSKFNIYRELFIKHNAIAAMNDYATPLFYYNRSEFPRGYESKLPLRWYSKYEIEHISEMDRERILKAYDYQNVRYEENTTLVVFQGVGPTSNPLKNNTNFIKHFIKNRMRSITLYSYQNILDFYTNKEPILIKTHPNVPISKNEVKTYFNSNITLLSKMPAEFINTFDPQFFTVPFNKVIMVGSSSNIYYKEAKNSYLLGRPVNEMIVIINKLYFTIKICITSKRTVYCYGFDAIEAFRFLALQEEVVADFQVDFKMALHNDYDITVIHKLKMKSSTFYNRLKDAQHNEIIILLNQDDANLPENGEFGDLNEFFVPMIINKEQLKKRIFVDNHEELFYIFCKDADTRKKLYEINKQKTLFCVGQKLICRAKEKTRLIN
jgi:hypothetical protein